jgi:hypothetical protein
MSRFTLVWLKAAEDELAELWLDPRQRNAVTSAAAVIESQLRDAPQRHAVHLSEGLWKIYRDPLKVYFSINEADRFVEVSQVRLIPPGELPQPPGLKT